MMSRMLGAPFGGTMRGGHHGLESKALSLITPPNGIGGAGICFPSMVTVALGAPGVPVICWAGAGETISIAAAAVRMKKLQNFVLGFIDWFGLVNLIVMPLVIFFLVRRFENYVNRTHTIL